MRRGRARLTIIVSEAREVVHRGPHERIHWVHYFDIENTENEGSVGHSRREVGRELHDAVTKGAN